ncbi:SCO family protein [Vibrio algivorus]|uniref:Photosynthetic protein synthase I n=1 Tax=Vibrio algivorus TaxID=1667024 RepID=A0ABQ6ELU5_9VIBR|nr:SCO family protein [Vibrio algivorus]GLT13691.1 photosynthetic protein synthase I [Vibrio algivorus]
MKKSWILILVFAFALGVTLNLFLQKDSTQTEATASITLETDGADNVDIFSADDPRIRIIYFGFTRCPDVCPTSLAMLAAALKQIEPQYLEDIRPMFITLDPERDSGTDAQKYAHYFHPSIEGYSGSLQDISTLAHQYGVIFQKTELADSALTYTIDHSSYFYFVKPDGSLLKKVPHTLNPQPLILAIQQIEKEDAQ